MPMNGTAENLSPTMRAALKVLESDGVIWPYNGISWSTVAALRARGLCAVEVSEPTRQYGTLGSIGHRGILVSQWEARPVTPCP